MKQLLLTVHLLLQAMFSKLLYTKRIEVLLLDKLFNGTSYNINSLPRLPGGVVNLTFDVAIQQLINLNEKKEVIELSMWIRQYWNDPFFVWNTSEWQDLNRLIVSPDRVWKPDIKLYNNADKDFQGLDVFGKTKVTVYSNGNVVWLIPTILRFYTILISEIGFALIVNCIIITLDTKTTHVPKWIGAIFLQNNFKFFIIALKNKVFSKLSQNSQTTFQNSLFQDAVQRCSKDTKNILSGYPYYEKTKATTFFDTRSNLEKTLITESDPINFESFVINKDFEYLELNEYLCAEFDCNKTQKEWKEVLKSIDVLFFIFFFDCNNRKHRFYFFNCTQC
ncbi:5-hydroxytryptamine receptor 3E isoform X3 [Hydra vulgaris]|uniref:5-hydroxytryptamine receptor 3E isoform X3 n=1 Tax=Hydra vulgaris TaxID=6087 RepID=UPI001F5F0FB2|nr:5-hydroxytryptamine receptor 3E isoform X3 [Hydra vulgaris]